MMRQVDLAYFAGIFDGEGCVVLHSKTYTKNSGKTVQRHYLEVSVCNNNEWLINCLKFSFGGNVYYRADKIWVWQSGSRIAGNFLSQLFPYLKLKKPQAEVALRFQATKTQTRKLLTIEEEEWEETQKMLIRSFNQSNSRTKNRHSRKKEESETPTPPVSGAGG